MSAKVLAVILLSSLIPWGFCQAAGTPDSFVKWRHFEEAQAIADRDDKLLIVVQGPDDCSIDLQECIFPREFAGSAFPDNGHSAFYEFRAVLSYRQSGKVQIQARKVDDKQRAKSRIARRNRGNVLTYFCTPEGKVLHFLVGFPTPELMQAETDWSFQLLRRLDGLTRYERATAVKEAHQRRLAERTIGPMANWSALLSNDMTGRPSLIKLAVSVAKQRDQLILAQYGTEWTLQEKRVLVTTLRKHAELTPESSHLVMQGFPLESLSELEQAVFMAFTRQNYSQPPVRRKQIESWFKSRRAESRSVLLVVSSIEPPKEIPIDLDGLTWQPKRKTIQTQLANFAVLELNQTELVCLFADIGQEPPSKLDQVQFLIFQSGRDIPKVLDRSKNESQLQRVLAKAISHD